MMAYSSFLPFAGLALVLEREFFACDSRRAQKHTPAAQSSQAHAARPVYRITLFSRN